MWQRSTRQLALTSSSWSTCVCGGVKLFLLDLCPPIDMARKRILDEFEEVKPRCRGAPRSTGS